MDKQDDHIPAIRYLEHTAIDRLKWDACISESEHGLIYSMSFYLDTMAGKWDALVAGDYAYVMPLPWRQKARLKYIYPPAFTQQLGISSRQAINSLIVELFISAIPKHFRWIEMNLQQFNPVERVDAVWRKNYLLPILSWPEMSAGISRSALRNINKAKQSGIIIRENEAVADIIALHRNRFHDAIGVTGHDYQQLEKLLTSYQQNGHAYTLAAFNQKGERIAGSIYLVFNKRLIFIFNGNSPESLQNGSTHLLMEHTLRHFSGQNMLLDFEGSDDPAFARFYEQYGASVVYYPFIKINRLPWFLRYFKS